MWTQKQEAAKQELVRVGFTVLYEDTWRVVLARGEEPNRMLAAVFLNGTVEARPEGWRREGAA